MIESVPPDGSVETPAESHDISVDAAPRAATRLFVLPAIVAGVVVCILALYFLFGAITRDTRSPESYLDEVRSGRSTRRWQAAYELSRILESSEKPVDPETAGLVLTVFREAVAKGEDARVKRYLALTLGRIGDRAAAPDLAAVLTDPDPETRIYAALALGRIGDRSATVPLTAALSDDDDPGVRKAAAYALGVLADPAASEALREALHDRAIDVTWNAAVALARLGDPTGIEILRSMADREFVERASQSEDPASRSAVIVTALHALVMLEDREAVPALKKLATADPDLKVRQAAIEAIQALSGGKQSS